MFNFVGNKIKYIDFINNILEKNKDINTFVDPFMGSGNILFKLSKNIKYIKANDIVSIMPNLYKNFYKADVSEEMFINVNNRWNKFKTKDDYYYFRNYWNEKYKNKRYNKSFVVETFMLFRLCSNSMIRFNKKGEFNQAFRGISINSLGFFKEEKFAEYSKSLQLIRNEIKLKKHEFYNYDFLKFLSLFENNSKNVYLFDPPYVLTGGMYERSYNEENEKQLLNYINDNDIKFIYFNFLEREQKKIFIKKFNNLNFIELSNKSRVGQANKKTLNVKEVLITNLLI